MRALIRAAEFHTDLAEPGRGWTVFRGGETTPPRREREKKGETARGPKGTNGGESEGKQEGKDLGGRRNGREACG